MFHGDQYKALMDYRSDRPDTDPSFALLYLLVVPLLAGAGFVAWLGWGWPALVLTVVTALLVAAVVFRLSVKRYRRDSASASDPEWR